MIDTDKYEGCRTKAWRDAWNIPYEELVEAQLRMHEQGPNECTQADLELFADAPLLLAEVKRLRKQLELADEWVQGDSQFCGTYKEWVYGDEEE